MWHKKALLSQSFGLLTFLLIEAVDEMYLLTIGQHDERSAIAELHSCRFRGIERWPIRESFSVGIASLGEVYPILLHDFCNSRLCRIFVRLCEELAVEIKNVIGMSHATAAGITREASC